MKDDRILGGGQGGERLVEIGDDRGIGRGDAGGAHDLFRPGFAALDPGGGGGRSANGDAGSGHAVGKAQGEGLLRADNDEVDPVRGGGSDDAVEVVDLHGKVGGDCCGAGVARGAPERGRLGALR